MLNTGKDAFNREELIYESFMRNRKKHSLTSYDMSILGYLCFLSRRRVFISLTASTLAEKLNEPYGKTAACIQKLIKADLVRKGPYRDRTGLMVSPLLISNGAFDKKAFKSRLWEKFGIQN